MTQPIRLWDLPTRLFHWLLVAAMGAAWASGEIGGNWMVWHGRIGLFIVGLIGFRLAWGVIGSTYARFATFVRGPASIRAYLKGEWHGLGHNPLGALSVLGLLALVALQAGLGLFAYNDDISFGGPFYARVTSDCSNLFTKLHHRTFNVLLLLIVLHIAAILFYAHAKKDNLVKPMLTGTHEGTPDQAATGGGAIAVIAALLIACVAVYGASGAWLPDPPPPAATPTPNW